MGKIKIGVVDTTFSRVNMGKVAVAALKNYASNIQIIYRTVPGMKDLPAGAKILLTKDDCDICMALGMPGKEKLDEMCAHEASLGIIMAQLLTNKHIIEVFVHESEVKDNDKLLLNICENRIRKHAINAVDLLLRPDKIQKNAGSGKRQGYDDEKSIK